MILRGLSVHAADRYPSMNALLKQLRRNPGKERRLALYGLGILALVALPLLGRWVGRTREDRLCQGAAHRLVGVWDASTRASLAKAFAASDLPYGEHLAAHVGSTLDRYAASWVALETGACRATRILGTQSEDMLTLQRACLSQGLAELEALVRIFSRASATVVEHAYPATHALVDVSSCADVERLATGIRPPGSEATARIVEEIRTRLTQARVMESTGQPTPALGLASEAVAAARKAGYPPVEAEALFQLGFLQARAGDSPAATMSLSRARWLSDATGYLELRARISNMLVRTLAAEPSRARDAPSLGQLNRALIERLGKRPALLSDWHTSMGYLLGKSGQPEKATQHLADALALQEKALEEDHPLLVDTLDALAAALGQQGKPEKAARFRDRARAIREKIFGPDLGPGGSQTRK